jgi:hypothetical protein
MLMWLVHGFVALVVAGFANMLLVSSGTVSPHNGAPAILVFAAVLGVLRLSERQPSTTRHDSPNRKSEDK